MNPPTADSGRQPAPLINLQGVSKTYHSAAGEFPALKQVDALFYPGEFVSVVGKSGSGKSTLVNMITGIDHPSAGQVLVEDVDIHQLSESQRAAWRGLNLGIIFQFFQLLPNLTLLENVMLPMDFCHKYDRAERPERARRLLTQVGLQDHANALPASVSGGEQQRAAIARALANDPPIVIADEPTGNLDTNAAATVNEIFQGLIRRGKTIIMVTHDPQLADKTQRQLLLSDGELINPHIAASLPFLSHQRMLWLTHQMEAIEVPANTSMQTELATPPGLVLVIEGGLEADSLVAGTKQASRRFKPGASLIQPQFNGNGKPLTSIQESTTRLLCLPQPAFERWMEQEPEHRARLASHSQAQASARLMELGEAQP